MSSNKENIIYRKQFQNANQIYTVNVQRKPKVAIQPKIIPPFKRSCALRNEIGKVKQNHPNPKLHKQHKESRKENINKNDNKLNTKKSDLSFKDFLIAKNIITENDISGNNSERETTVNSEHISSTSVSKRKTHIYKHLSIAKKYKNISLQCDMSQEEAKTVRVGYLPGNIILPRQKPHNNTNKKLQNISDQNIFSAKNEILQKEYSNDQTHTPFGESALRLIHQLKERLRSRGDSESSDMINQIFSKAGHIRSEIESGKKIDSGKDEVFKYTSAPDNNSQLNENIATLQNNDKLIIENQKMRIEQLEKSNEDLQNLSSKLLEYHKNVINKPHLQNASQNDHIPTKLSKAERVEIDAEEKESMKALNLERDALLKKIKSQRDLIFNLEVNLEKMESELKKIKNYVSSMSRTSKQLTNVRGCEVNQNYSRVPNWDQLNIQPNIASKANTRSDTDSAFEDRSVSLTESKSRSQVRTEDVVERSMDHNGQLETIAPRCTFAVLTSNEDCSVTRRSDFTDDEAAKSIMEREFPLNVLKVPNKYHETPLKQNEEYSGKILESTRISSDATPKNNILTENSSVYVKLQPELTSS